ncbi:hypothetical protein DNH61_15835 [Paenibacillus sambharensis]|uniref:Uncharacterized protein n=1 Tax=Paenibacillus sambharensis TaxID=1803190 RepID=A0A2W1LIH3_9BACL|nr:hypothetical protein DNH61_15835 [Paenibacillus sambharensis]
MFVITRREEESFFRQKLLGPAGVSNGRRAQWLCMFGGCILELRQAACSTKTGVTVHMFAGASRPNLSEMMEIYGKVFGLYQKKEYWRLQANEEGLYCSNRRRTALPQVRRPCL